MPRNLLILSGVVSPEGIEPRLSPASVDIDLDVQHNTALGCRTSEAALTLLAQLIRLEGRDVMAISTSELETLTATYTALVAELEPKTATEAMLAVQMVGARRAAMCFLGSATLPDRDDPG
ncbi:MAG: hypothetical protein LC791_18535 [Acidobacteria bacterium]|nr:hypothetical protein [Acidobacteriota bacterium]